MKLEEVNLENMDDFIDLFSRQVVEKKMPAKKTLTSAKQEVIFNTITLSHFMQVYLLK